MLGTLAGVAAVWVAVAVFRHERAERARDRDRADAIRRAERILPIYQTISAQLDLFDTAVQLLREGPLIADDLDALGLAALGAELARRFDGLGDDVDLDGDRRAFTGALRRMWHLRDAQQTLIRARHVPAVPAPTDLETALRQWNDEQRADTLHQHLRDLARGSAAQAAAATESAAAIMVLRQHTDQEITHARDLLDGRNRT